MKRRRIARLTALVLITILGSRSWCARATESLSVTPAMLSGPLNFFATSAGVQFAEPIPYGFANNLADNGWIWPNDNSGELVVDFGVPTALSRFRVYCVYNDGERGATWVIEHSSDRSDWFHATDFIYRPANGAGVDDDGIPVAGFGGWYESNFNDAGFADRFWRIRQTDVLVSHAPRSGHVEFYGGLGSSVKPRLKSKAPTGNATRRNSIITVELEDGTASQVAPVTIQLLLDAERVTPALSKPVGTNVTTVTYDPRGTLSESAHTVRIIFADTSSPPAWQTNDFGFVVINDTEAARVINLDFNGVRNDPGPDVPGPTFVGQGAAGGGTVWNGLNADSRVQIPGLDNDQLTVSGSQLLNSIGDTTPLAFTISPVGGDVSGTPTSDPNSILALLSDEIFTGSSGADFTLSNLEAVPLVDLYFYTAGARILISGAEEGSDISNGNFLPANTHVFRNVPVIGGAVHGRLEGDPGQLAGLTLVRPAPHPFVKSVSPMGRAATPSPVITVELEDYVTQVASASIQLLLNDQTVRPEVIKLPDSQVTTVRFDSRGSLPEGNNRVKVIFADTGTPTVIQTNEFSFTVVAGNQLLVAPEMLSGPLNFFASPSDLKFAEPIPYGVSNNVSDNGWIWPNDNSGSLLIDFGAPTALDRLRVYSTYPGGARGAVWAIEHSDDKINWINSTNFLFETSAGGGVDADGAPRADYAGWYEALFNPAGESFPFWRIRQTAVTASHAPRAAQIEFFQLSAPATPLSVLINMHGGKLSVEWVDPLDNAILESAERISGPWEELPSAFSPHVVPPEQPQRYFRLRR